jgi:hypothetical protein
MSENLVIIRTFGNHLDADEAQVELLRAGIHCLLFSDESMTLHPNTAPGDGIALAVHQRDVNLADAALTVKPRMA